MYQENKKTTHRMGKISVNHISDKGIVSRIYKLNNKNTNNAIKNEQILWGTWLAQLVESATLDLGVVSSSPTKGVEIT